VGGIESKRIMRDHRVAGPALVVLLAVTGGCFTTSPIAPSSPLRPITDPPLADVPVPVGFRLQERSCEDWSSGAIRYVRHRYLGKADKNAVRKFYREQMPLLRWSAVSEGQVAGRHTLRFKRPKESCTITVSDADVHSARTGVIAVEVMIAPDRDGTHR